MTKITEAQARAVKKYQKKVYDQIGITLPKGTRERIHAAAAIEGKSPNAWIREAILEKLEEMEIATDRTDAQPDAERNPKKGLIL